MPTVSYLERRKQLETYFDHTALDAWSRLTSDAPVGRIRATVRAGRDRMRATLLSWLPDDLSGKRVLDAGCGTGLLSIEAARRGAHVTAIDLSPKLIKLAQQRSPTDLGRGHVDFKVGDMLHPSLGQFDHIVAMDSLIHYEARDTVQALERLAARASTSVVFTFPPRTAALALMHAAGRFFPSKNRAPALEPVAETTLRHLIGEEARLIAYAIARTQRIDSGFYTSQAMELRRA
jgi:magnesium-protoporphyrin O-methyltransferase